MTKDERVSMFNAAQARDMKEKTRVIKGQGKGKAKVTAEDDPKIFTVRIPRLLHAAMMQDRMMTGVSMNTIIVEALYEHYPEDCAAMKMAHMSLEMGLDE